MEEELRFSVDIDKLGDLEWQDLEALQSDDLKEVRRVLAQVVEGGDEAIRHVKLRNIRTLADAVGDAAKKLGEQKN